jgi:hypothetical protein
LFALARPFAPRGLETGEFLEGGHIKFKGQVRSERKGKVKSALNLLLTLHF